MTLFCGFPWLPGILCCSWVDRTCGHLCGQCFWSFDIVVRAPHSKLNLLMRIACWETICSDTERERERHVCWWFQNSSKSTVMFAIDDFRILTVEFAILFRGHRAGCNSSNQTAEGTILLRSGHQGILADWLTFVHPFPWISDCHAWFATL